MVLAEQRLLTTDINRIRLIEHKPSDPLVVLTRSSVFTTLFIANQQYLDRPSDSLFHGATYNTMLSQETGGAVPLVASTVKPCIAFLLLNPIKLENCFILLCELINSTYAFKQQREERIKQP